MSEAPIRAVITARFDLGFILEHPNGRSGQLRVPEMSESTMEWDRSPERHSGVGKAVEVYVVLENDHGYLFSEFNAEERSRREQERQDWIQAQERTSGS